MKCNHVNRVVVDPSIKIGGASLGRCEREVLPGMVVCEYHATPDAVRILVNQLDREIDRLEQALADLKYGER